MTLETLDKINDLRRAMDEKKRVIKQISELRTSDKVHCKVYTEAVSGRKMSTTYYTTSKEAIRGILLNEEIEHRRELDKIELEFESLLNQKQ